MILLVDAFAVLRGFIYYVDYPALENLHVNYVT